MAMLIMTVGLLGLLQSVNVAYEHATRKKLRDEALLVGEEQMNLLKRMNFDSSTPYRNVTSPNRMIGGVAKRFTVTRECLALGNTNRLRVTVGWSFRNLSSSHSIYTLKNR